MGKKEDGTRERHIRSFKIVIMWEFPGGPVVRTQCFHCGDPGSIPGQGTKIPHAM